jgi:hypothetical protein
VKTTAQLLHWSYMLAINVHFVRKRFLLLLEATALMAVYLGSLSYEMVALRYKLLMMAVSYDFDGLC